MALIESFDEIHKDVNRVHEPVSCGFTAFEDGGKRYLQLDTYGSPDRKDKGTVSQSIQLDENGALTLLAVLKRTFPSIA